MPGGYEWERDCIDGDEAGLEPEKTKALCNRRKKRRIELDLFDANEQGDQEMERR